MINRFDHIKATVKIRRDLGLKVKPEAELIDGQEFNFIAGWLIEDGVYKGEMAMLPEGGESPLGWIASGDLDL